jgi:hypothetical protein
MDDKMTIDQIVKQYFPDADEGFIEYVLWHRTAFPCGIIGNSYEDDVRNACKVLKDAQDKGIKLCDFCDDPAIFGKLCQKCHDAMESQKKEIKE